HGQTLTDGDRRRDKLIWLAEVLGNHLATEFTAQQFAAYRERRLAGELYVLGQRKQVSPTTINRELLFYLQAVFNELGRLGEWAYGNPLEVLRQYKVQEFELAFLNQDEIEQLLAVCTGLNDL
ncbi:site-specific integrase, partial [Aeromonas simiae]|nr:site-specific integrase [Aeromonas simiae]MDO2952386.1 site-specific integrase [Aeromonas simiae]MDO2957513.1 site-specific integrase [Aeromonas simiae]